ncbi:CGNR zinc finger domain-containing protein [Euzebya tangerina]|uniref:CGNR zinc finger domain-containing protein n=1 Tax=Euzebya tangerina TaxID=591198 RepID=UPI000E31293E|nr:CGNR zinc finger domain-containing protein [Euzebya tangerina]
MDYGHYTTQTMEETVALTNGLANGERSISDDELEELLVRFGTWERGIDIEGLTHLASRLRSVFLADDEADQARILNELIAFYQPHPTITDHDGQGFHLHYGPPGAGHLRMIATSMTMAVALVFCDYGADRLGVCPDCEDVFVDTTRNGRQRFCSRTCANRVHVARHRERTRSE